MLNISTLLLSCSCLPKSSTISSRSGSQQADLQSGTDHNVDSGDVANESRQSSSILFDQKYLEELPLQQIKSYYKTRTTQLEMSKKEYAIDHQIGNELCVRLQNLRASCVVSNHLTPYVKDTLKCAQAAPNIMDTEASHFSVLLTDTSGNPLKAIDGQFVLVANTNYISDPFSVSADQKPKIIKFNAQMGSISGGDSPEIEQVNSLELRRANEISADILNGKGVKLPSRTSFFVQLFYNSVKLTDGLLIDVANASFVGYRYKVSLEEIFNMSRSSKCTIQKAEIDNIKNQVRAGVENKTNDSQASSVFSKKNVIYPSKEKMIEAILAAQDSLAELTPMLNSAQNRILALTGELVSGQTIGCHASEPIKSISINIQGVRNNPKPLGKFGRCPTLLPNGPGSVIAVRLGEGITINIDQNKYGMGGTAWVGQVPNQSLVGGIEYLQLSKLGITIDNLGEHCVPSPMGLGKPDCSYVCQEDDTFSITGVKISVDTPSVSSFTIYDNQNINIVMGSSLYSSSAIVTWNENAFRSNPNWVNFMYDTNCDTTN